MELKILMFDLTSTGVDIRLRKLGVTLIKTCLANVKNIKPEVLYIHADSLFKKNSEHFKAEYEEIKDIAEYNYSFPKLFEEFKPTVVITTHQGNLIARALIKTARESGVPTIYLQYAEIVRKTHKKSTKNKLFDSFHSYFKQLRSYIKASSPFIVFSPSVLLYLLYGLLGKHVVYYPPLPSKDNRCDLACVRNEYYKNYLKKHFRYNENKVIVVGDPDIVLKTGVIRDKTKLLYIMQPVVEDGFISLDDWLKFVETIEDVARFYKLKALFKSHPRNSSEIIKILLNKFPSITIDRNIKPEILGSFGLAIGHNSTLCKSLIAHKVPLIVYKIPELDTSSLEEYAYKIVDDLEELRSTISNLISSDDFGERKTNEAYERLYASGEINENGTFETIVKIIIELARKN